MRLADIIARTPRPEPWSEGDNIPWNEPGFSARMLREHLTQDHPHASRRFEVIDRHVAWLHHRVLGDRPARILDLGCGPGLYSSRLARLGHACVGIDYSPASIAYAQEEARREGLSSVYHLEDIRRADYGAGYDAVLLLYGEFNVFCPQDIDTILRRAHDALAPGGALVLEVSDWDSIHGLGTAEPSWFGAMTGLFSERPHVMLRDAYWDETTSTVTIRHYVVDAETAEVTRMAQTLKAYTEEGYREALVSRGFADLVVYPSLTGENDGVQPDMYVFAARRP